MGLGATTHSIGERNSTGAGRFPPGHGVRYKQDQETIRPASGPVECPVPGLVDNVPLRDWKT